MKYRIIQFIASIILICWASSVSLAQKAETRPLEGIRTGMDQFGGYICLGQWVGPQGAKQCQGELIAASAYAAVYAGVVADRIAKTNELLASINQKLEAGNASADKTRAAIEKMTAQTSETIQAVVVQRFDALPVDLLQNEVVKKALDKLKEDILADVKKLINKQ